MKYYTSLVELWILEHLFQRFSDLSFKYLRLTNFFWAVVSLAITLSCYLYLTYTCLLTKEYVVMLTALPIFGLFVPIVSNSIKRARLQAYDHATWGLENPLKLSESAARRGALEMTFVVTGVWILISVKHEQFAFGTLVWWIPMLNYPTLCFCACNAPGRRF